MMNYRIILSRLLLIIGLYIVSLLLLSCGNETQLSQGEELTSVPVNVRLLTRMSSRAETKVSDKDNLFNRLLLVVTKPDAPSRICSIIRILHLMLKDMRQRWNFAYLRLIISE